MNILITRPLIDSEDLMGKLFSEGHKIIHIPTLKISTAKIDPVDPKKYDAFIFTSANAIRNLKLINQKGAPKPRVWNFYSAYQRRTLRTNPPL